MDKKTTLSISEARKKIFEITEDVQKPGTSYTLTERGRPKAVIMSVDEHESWAETLEVIKDFPDLKKDVAETKKAVRIGSYRKWTALEDLLRKEGFVVADKSPKKYGVSIENKTGGRKRNRKTF
ncbi:MAG: type II toxin-antitoxin system Phd/YefM family antitoxin [Candidatus Paceibacterota bacterium]|jgi:prevent-host-death family protein